MSIERKKIAYVSNAGANSGVGYRAKKIGKIISKKDYDLQDVEINGTEGKLCIDGKEHAQISNWPGALGSKTVNWIRLGKQYQKYAKHNTNDSIFHFTNQSLSFLSKKLHPSVVTVHDLIEILEPQDKRAYWLNKYLYSGIRSADQVIAVSQFTAKTIKERYNIPDENITVIYNGVDDDYYQIPDFKQTVGYKTLLQELHINEGSKIVLYIGSEHPRKNVPAALRAFASALKVVPDTVFIKIGAPGLANGRKQTLEEIDHLAIRDNVKIIDSVSNEKLNEFYNLADIFIWPSNLEGFGLPPLQAMACGTPVVSSNAASMPEVVGDDKGFGECAALTHDPDDIAGMTASLKLLLTSDSAANSLIAKGLKRAKMFSWEKAAEQEIEVYSKL